MFASSTRSTRAATVLPTAASGRFNGQVETIPAGDLCDFDVKLMYGTWHLLLGPEGLQYEKCFRDRTSVWDGTADDINSKICEFLS